MKNMFNPNKPLINQLGLAHLLKVYELSNKLFNIKILNKLNKKSLKFRGKLKNYNNILLIIIIWYLNYFNYINNSIICKIYKYLFIRKEQLINLSSDYLIRNCEVAPYIKLHDKIDVIVNGYPEE